MLREEGERGLNPRCCRLKRKSISTRTLDSPLLAWGGEGVEPATFLLIVTHASSEQSVTIIYRAYFYIKQIYSSVSNLDSNAKLLLEILFKGSLKLSWSLDTNNIYSSSQDWIQMLMEMLELDELYTLTVLWRFESLPIPNSASRKSKVWKWLCKKKDGVNYILPPQP